MQPKVLKGGIEQIRIGGQRYAGRKRADYWRNLGFTNLTRARIAAATIREMRRQGAPLRL